MTRLHPEDAGSVQYDLITRPVADIFGSERHPLHPAEPRGPPRNFARPAIPTATRTSHRQSRGQKTIYRARTGPIRLHGRVRGVVARKVDLDKFARQLPEGLSDPGGDLTRAMTSTTKRIQQNYRKKSTTCNLQEEREEGQQRSSSRAHRRLDGRRKRSIIGSSVPIFSRRRMQSPHRLPRHPDAAEARARPGSAPSSRPWDPSVALEVLRPSLEVPEASAQPVELIRIAVMTNANSLPEDPVRSA